jgi:predicted lactoylglutathione lyase
MLQIASKSTEAIIALDAQSSQQVDEIVKKAVEAGGSIYRDAEDHGWMYGKSFADLDGHQWEILFMDEAAIPKS